jgi:hypothetical protein
MSVSIRAMFVTPLLFLAITAPVSARPLFSGSSQISVGAAPELTA